MAYEGLRAVFGPLLRRNIKIISGEENLPATAPFILASNHVGFFDPLALVTFIDNKFHRPTYFITIKSQWRLWGEYLGRRWLAMIPLHDAIKERRSQSLDEAIKIAKQGEIIGIFPEGTRNLDPNNLLKGKTGAIRLALASDVQIFPVGLANNTGHSFPDMLLSFFDKNKGMVIKIGSPVDLNEFKNKPVDKQLLESATRKLMIAIGRLCNKKYSF